jgi:hypothetical protein
MAVFGDGGRVPREAFGCPRVAGELYHRACSTRSGKLRGAVVVFGRLASRVLEHSGAPGRGAVFGSRRGRKSMRGRALPRGGAAAGDFGCLSLTAKVLHGAFGPSALARSFPGVPSGLSGGVFAAAWGSSVPEACGVGFKGSKGHRRRGRFVRGAVPGHRGEQGFEVGFAAP